MTLLIIALLVFLIIVASNNKTQPTPPENKKKATQFTPKATKELDQIINTFYKNDALQVTTTLSHLKNDTGSVIDVSQEAQSIDLVRLENTIPETEPKVPVWPHQYVYAASEINNATNEQLKFYNQFKYRFLKGQYIDLQGNNNYAFILLFDLIDDYESHRNLLLTERQLDEAGKYYPKTKPYALPALIKKLERIGDSNALPRLKEQLNASWQYRSTYQQPYYESNYWGIGTKYKAKLQLSDAEVKLLNKLPYISNNFCSIENCFIEVIKIYLSTIEELKAKCGIEGTTVENMINSVADIILQKNFKYKPGSNNYIYSLDAVIMEIYSNIFKRCENLVREFYGHKRKINADIFYTNQEARLEFETKIITVVTGILANLTFIISSPIEAVELELNAQNTTRWKLKLDEIKAGYKMGEGKAFINNILKLGQLNKRNPSVENIFFEASKFIAKTDKSASLALYIYYLYYDLKSVTFDNKQLTKTIQKNLFENNEQLHDFQRIVSEFVSGKDLTKALEAVSKLYEPKRKKIRLDSRSIIEVQEQHSETVELLNEYLKDEYEDENSTIKSQEINDEELKIEIFPKAPTDQHSVYITDIAFTQIQIETLDLFAKSNFNLEQIDLENYAKRNGIFKNQLVDSINEICYEKIDDILIEEEDENYIMNQNYYQTLLKND